MRMRETLSTLYTKARFAGLYPPAHVQPDSWSTTHRTAQQSSSDVTYAYTLPSKARLSTYTRTLGSGLPLGLRCCDPHGFNPLILEPLRGMLLLPLLLQGGPAL